MGGGGRRSRCRNRPGDRRRNRLIHEEVTGRPANSLSSKNNKPETFVRPSIRPACCTALGACRPRRCVRRRPLPSRPRRETVGNTSISPLAEQKQYGNAEKMP